MVKAAAFAVPGDLATPTGGYAYDRHIVAELRASGWQIEVVDIGTSFPHADAAARGAVVGIVARPGDGTGKKDGGCAMNELVTRRRRLRELS